MFAFTKVVKLMGLFRRHPADICYLPLSIVFGYLHGLIKLYALITLNMVCHFLICLPGPLLTITRQTSWGSRADGDTNDEQRLAPAPRPSVVLTTPPGNASLIRFNVRHKGRCVQTQDEQDATLEKRGYVAYDSSTSYIPIRVPSAFQDGALGYNSDKVVSSY